MMVVTALLVVSAPGGESSTYLGSVPAAAAASQPSGPVSSGNHEPTVAFADTEYSVLLLGRIFGRTEVPGGNPDLPRDLAEAASTNTFTYFGELETEQRHDADLDLTFMVEGRPDASNYQYCRQDSPTCHNTEVRVLPDKGLLYFWYSGSTINETHWPAAFAPQRLEVSASETGTGLKVYREVLVNPPPEAEGCEDYGENSVEAYVCIYLREFIPDGAGGGSNEGTLRAGLPGLVYDSSNYNLVFAEEFDGTPPAANDAGCSDGLSTLDDSIWNYNDACVEVDPRGESCGNIADGSLTIARAHKCRAKLSTYGKLHYRYGYLEFKYTVNMDRWTDLHANMNLLAWVHNNSRKHLWSQYGVPMNDWEDYLKYGDVEMDFLEYVPPGRHQSWNTHANWHQSIADNLPGYRGRKQIYFCWNSNYSYYGFWVNPGTCRAATTFTVTQGVEWTPRGYRTFMKLDDFHDELTLVTEQYIEITEFRQGRVVHPSEDERSRYFEYIKPDDPSTILEQVAIGHTPNPLSIATWGYPASFARPPSIRTRMEFDYVRLWQPENHYSDMEPVYQ